MSPSRPTGDHACGSVRNTAPSPVAGAARGAMAADQPLESETFHKGTILRRAAHFRANL